MTTHSITEKQIQGTDPLASIFFDILHFKYYSIALFFIFTGLAYGYVIPALSHVSPASDWITIINIVLVFPTAGYYYNYQPKSILRVYRSIMLYFKEENEASIPFDELQAWHAKPIWWIVGVSIGATSAGFGVSKVIEGIQYAWEGIHWGQTLLIFGVRFVAMSMIGIIVMRHIATSIVLTKLFKHTEFPLALDTDRVEVFSAVKRFSLEIIGVAAIIGLNLGLQPFVIEVPIVEYSFYVAAYFILVPVTFFLPLWQVHHRMVKLKSQMLDKLYSDYQEEAEKLYDALALEHKRDLDSSYLKQTASMISIKQTIDLIDGSPDWPFAGTVFYRLIITILSPFLLVIFEIFINIISNVIAP